MTRRQEKEEKEPGREREGERECVSGKVIVKDGGVGECKEQESQCREIKFYFKSEYLGF